MWDSDRNSNSSYEEVPENFKIEVPTFSNEEEEIKEEPSIFQKYIPDNDWKDFFIKEMGEDYFKDIETKFKESSKKTLIHPRKKQIFRAFHLTPLSKIKVIILGQDPYPGQCKKTKKPFANGLAFSVNKSCSIPMSLRNMYKELDRVGIKPPKTGELEPWAKQGVFLINTQLSVEQGNANSHKFWNKFTDNVIKYISSLNKNLVFVLMGGNALKKYKLIKKNKNTKLVITSHPSPLSHKRTLKSYPSFTGSDIFLNINKKLKELGQESINW